MLNTHFVWSTKYRKPVLIPPIDNRIQELLLQLLAGLPHSFHGGVYAVLAGILLDFPGGGLLIVIQSGQISLQ